MWAILEEEVVIFQMVMIRVFEFGGWKVLVIRTYRRMETGKYRDEAIYRDEITIA